MQSVIKSHSEFILVMHSPLSHVKVLSGHLAGGTTFEGKGLNLYSSSSWRFLIRIPILNRRSIFLDNYKHTDNIPVTLI